MLLVSSQEFPHLLLVPLISSSWSLPFEPDDLFDFLKDFSLEENIDGSIYA